MTVFGGGPLGRPGVEAPGQERPGHVGRGHVAAHRGECRRGRRSRLPGAEPPQLLEHAVEPLALDELHDVVGRLALLADAEDGHDVGVVELGRGPRLALEPAAGLGVLEHLPGEHLQGHMPAQRDLLGLVDDAHAAAAHLADDAVVAELLQGRQTSCGKFPGCVRLERLVGEGDVLHHRHGREDLADLAGQLGVVLDILAERGPLPLAIAVEELLGELEHQGRS
jgi:hypothetical protein